MSKITLNDVTNINSLSVINDNFDKIEQELQNKVLYRDNPIGEPNTVEKDIDINGKSLLNVGEVYSVNGRWATINEVEDIRDEVAANAVIVEANKDIAVASANSAATSYDNFDDRYLGQKASDPVVDNDGGLLLTGALYFRTSGTPIMRVYNGTTWQDVGSITTTTTNLIDPTLYSSQAEAEAGLNNTKVITPLRAKDAIDSQVKAGFTSTGAIVLPGIASADLQAMPRQQLRSTIGSGFSNLSCAATGANNIVSVAADEVVVKNSSGDPILASAVSLSIDVSTSGANGLDTGTIAANTWYSIWVIWNGSVKSGLASLSTTSPTLPGGYTHKARVGWFRQGTSFPRAFKQYGRRVRWVNTGSGLPAMVGGAAQGNVIGPTWVAVSTSNFVPVTASSIAFVLTSTGGANGQSMVAPSNAYGIFASTANPPPVVYTTPGAAALTMAVSAEFLLESSNIYWAHTGNFYLAAHGWEDNL